MSIYCQFRVYFLLIFTIESIASTIERLYYLVQARGYQGRKLCSKQEGEDAI